MTKRILLLLLVALPLFSFGQKKFLEINNDIKKGGRDVKASYPIINNETGEFALFLDDNKRIYGFLYDKDKNLIEKIVTEGLPKRYNEIIGYSIDSKKIRLFLKNKNNKTFGSVLFDFDTGQTAETIYDFKLKDEIYLEGYNNNQIFYLITISKGSNNLNFYVFQENQEFAKKTVNISSKYFSNEKSLQKELSEIMLEKSSLGSYGNIDVGKIDVDSPNALESTSKSVKIYPENDGFVLTIDSDSWVYIIDFSTPSLEYELNSFSKPVIPNLHANSNSFILENRIYMVSATKSQMKFMVKDMETGQELKTIDLNKEEEISFKNTPIIQEGGMSDGYREMEKTSKFLRQLANQSIGISVNPSEENYVITIGSQIRIGGVAPMPIPGFGGVPVAGIDGFIISFNPTFMAYGNYKFTKATRIECLFDKDYAHIPGKIPENVFDRINTLAEKVVFPDAENVFKIDGKYIWGYYNNPANKFLSFEF